MNERIMSYVGITFIENKIRDTSNMIWSRAEKTKHGLHFDKF